MNNNPGAYARIKSEPFKVLMVRIRDHYQSIDRACKETGISEQSYYKLIRDDSVSVFVGKKILAHWELLFGVEKVA